MTRRIHFGLFTFSIFVASTSTSVAQSSAFPWEGEVSGNNVNVRSGEGTRYYATCKLAAGDRVLVLGESSGWYKILPPPTSFSYIDKNAVERHTNDIGSVSRDKAYVRAGSHISRRKSRTQVILTKGDPVVILGEIDGFFKIEPPKNAVLYVSREFIKPVSAAQESGLVRRYSAADWSKAGESGADEAIDLPETADTTPPSTSNPSTTVARTVPANTQPAPSSVKTINADEARTPVRTPERVVTAAPRTPTPPIQANRPVVSGNDETQPRNSTLVLTPRDASTSTTDSPTSTSSRPGFSETNDTPPAPTNDEIAPNTYYIGATTNDDVMPDRPELSPADRRPPAQLPDWARDGNTTRTTSNTTEVRQYNTTTGGAPSEPAASPNRGSTYAASTTGATTTQRGGARMGVMVEVSPGASTNRPAPATNWNQPTTTGSAQYAAAPAQTNTTTGAGIVNYNRPDPNTLTLNATNASAPASTTTTPRPVANTPIASNQPIAASTTHAPRTIVDPRNSHPAAPMDSGYTTTTQSPGVTTSDTYYINSESTTTYASNTPVQGTQPAGQGDFTYPTPSTPPPEVPIDPASGPYAAKLVSLEGDLHAIMELPVQQRPYEQLIARYEEISIQSGERVPAEYAAIRIDQLKALERVRRLAVRYASDHDGLEHFSRRMEEERAEIRSAQQTTTTIEGGAFEYEGLLMRSYAFSPEKRRYRLVDPGTQSTIIYVDIPVAVYGNPDALNGKRVGIRVNRREYSDAAQIPIVEAASIVDLTAPPTKYQTIPGPQARKNGDFSNPANTGRDNPNPLMNAPMAREHSEPAPMGEMKRIES